MQKLFCLILLGLLALPAISQEWARPRLESSPRHLEWVELDTADQSRKLNCFVAYPEVKSPARTVILIHEIFGLTDWVRGVADQLAERGYLVIAPDLLSGMGPKGGGTSEFGGDDGARQAVSKLKPQQVTADLDLAWEYIKKQPASNGEVTVIGFCWGGSQSFRYATHNKGLQQALVFYGAGPESPIELQAIQAPVHGFYAENDARVNQTIPKTETAMRSLSKTYNVRTFTGAGHGFMRAGEAPDASGPNRKAREDAWKQIETLLSTGQSTNR